MLVIPNITMRVCQVQFFRNDLDMGDASESEVGFLLLHLRVYSLRHHGNNCKVGCAGNCKPESHIPVRRVPFRSYKPLTLLVCLMLRSLRPLRLVTIDEETGRRDTASGISIASKTPLRTIATTFISKN